MYYFMEENPILLARSRVSFKQITNNKTLRSTPRLQNILNQRHDGYVSPEAASMASIDRIAYLAVKFFKRLRKGSQDTYNTASQRQ